MARNELLRLAFITVLVMAISSCGDPAPTEILPQSPSPTPTWASPLAAPSSPLPRPQESTIAPVPFRLDKPLKEGDVRVTGTGPAGVPIYLEDVTFMGRFVAAGHIEEDGTFGLALAKPLEAQHRIGLTINLSGTPWTLDDFESSAFHGDEALSIPQVGFYFDTAMVQKP